MLWKNMIEQFQQAVTQFLKVPPPLLSVGERRALLSWNQLSNGAKQLYIFLFHRKPKQFRREHIQYVDPNKSHYFSNWIEEEHALKELEQLGFIVECQDWLDTDYF